MLIHTKSCPMPHLISHHARRIMLAVLVPGFLLLSQPLLALGPTQPTPDAGIAISELLNIDALLKTDGMGIGDSSDDLLQP